MDPVTFSLHKDEDNQVIICKDKYFKEMGRIVFNVKNTDQVIHFNYIENNAKNRVFGHVSDQAYTFLTMNLKQNNPIFATMYDKKITFSQGFVAYEQEPKDNMGGHGAVKSKYIDYTVKQLKSVAAKRKIKGYSTMKKDELIKALI